VAVGGAWLGRAVWGGWRRPCKSHGAAKRASAIPHCQESTPKATKSAQAC
jgi:hypothetical protein